MPTAPPTPEQIAAMIASAHSAQAGATAGAKAAAETGAQRQAAIDAQLAKQQAAEDAARRAQIAKPPNGAAQLNPGDTLLPGQVLISSPKKTGKLTFQTDGNLCLDWNGKRLWCSATAGKGAARLTMQKDGNAVIYNPAGKALWATGTPQRGGSILRIQDDGNLVLYQGTNPLWSTDTQNGKRTDFKGGGVSHISHGGIDLGDIAVNVLSVSVGIPPGVLAVVPGATKFAEVAVATSGRAVGQAASAVGDVAHDAVNTVAKATSDLAAEVGKVPVVGGLFTALVDVTIGGPWFVSADIVNGVPLDKAVSRELERQLKDFKAIGPYAQMVFSLVPGFGPFVAGAIGAGLALANGQSLDEAMLAGVEGMVPGGPLAQMAFKIAAKTISVATSPGGFSNLESVAEIGIGALPIPKQAIDVIDGGMRVVANLASGKRLEQALIDGAMKALPLDSLPQSAKNAILQAAETIKDVAKGEKIDHALLEHGLNALPISELKLPEAADKALKSLVDASKRLANGDHLDKVLIDAAIKNVPLKQLGQETQKAIGHLSDVADGMLKQAASAQIIVDAGQAFLASKNLVDKTTQAALKVGIAMGHAQGLQTIVKVSVTTGQTIAKVSASGVALIKSNPVVAAAGKIVPQESAHGFAVGVGVARTQVGLASYTTVRETLNADDKKGFDTAMALNTGLVTTNPPPGPAASVAGYAITTGAVSAPPDHRAAIVTDLITSPQAKAGVAVALQHIEKPAPKSFWRALAEFFHLA